MRGAGQGVKITYGEFRDGPDGIKGHPMLFIDVANIGYSPVTINAPYFELPDGHAYVPPDIMADVSFPFELNACKSCSRAVRYADVMQFFGTSCGYSGEVRLRGVIKDATGKAWKSKETWRLGLRDGKQGKRGENLESKAIENSMGNWREYGKYEGKMPFSKDLIKNLLKFLKEKYPNTIQNSATITAPFGNPKERLKVLQFCWEEGLIECTPIKTDQSGIEDFASIKITSKGIDYLRGL